MQLGGLGGCQAHFPPDVWSFLTVRCHVDLSPFHKVPDGCVRPLEPCAMKSIALVPPI
jgi:hypothetical protein